MIIIADDLTGANDSAVQYKKNGFSTIVKVLYRENDCVENYENYDILSVNTDTRPLNSQQAYDRVYAMTRQLCDGSMGRLYKKIDSILRGNPDSELEAVMDATDCHLALVAPSFPENGRSMLGGILAAGTLEINAVALFKKGMRRRVEGISLAAVREGAYALSKRLLEQHAAGVEVFLLDACSDADLETIKDAAKLIPEKMVLSGSAGLAKHLSADAEMVGGRANLPDQKQLILAAIGSRSKETAHQIQMASALYGVPILPLEVGLILEGNVAEAKAHCVEAVAREVKQGHTLALVAVDSLFKEHTVVRKENDAENDRAQQIVETLGSVIKQIYERYPVRAIISTGGDTSLSICKEFGTASIELLDEIAPGIPIGKMVGGKSDGTLIVTKSGGFGAGDTLIQVIEYLKNYKESN